MSITVRKPDCLDSADQQVMSPVTTALSRADAGQKHLHLFVGVFWLRPRSRMNRSRTCRA
jgi:hypothetical protein